MSARQDGWITAPLNSFTGMPLKWRGFGYHDAPGQSQRVIGAHVYIFQRTTQSITVWRSEMADTTHGYRWTRMHAFTAEAGAA